jgi:hypothetical protein
MKRLEELGVEVVRGSGRGGSGEGKRHEEGRTRGKAGNGGQRWKSSKRIGKSKLITNPQISSKRNSNCKRKEGV